MKTILTGAACAAALPAAAQAQQTRTATLDVTAQVDAACIVSTTPVAFGEIIATAAADTDAVGKLNIRCTDGTAWKASAGLGNGGSGASFTNGRLMSSSSGKLRYNLYTRAERLTVFGDGSLGTFQLEGTGNGGPQSVDIYGRVPGGQTTVPSGDYADTVAITVTY